MYARASPLNFLSLMETTTISVMVALVIGYCFVVLYFKKPHKCHDVYTCPGAWWVYYPRWVLRVTQVWLEQTSRRRRVNDYELKGRLYETCGIEATPQEKAMETPKPLITDRHEDALLIFGADGKGRALVVRVVRLTKRRASVYLSITTSQGLTYTLPHQPDSNVVNTPGDGWTVADLTVQCVDPMRVWRIKFNGLLRRGPREEYHTEHPPDAAEDDVVPARLDFLWRACGAPVDVWMDASPLLLAHALARETHASVSMFTSLERDGYEQWGSLHGQVQLGCGVPDTLEPETWYLRGLRQHKWGMQESYNNFHRSVDLFTFLDNGNVVSLQAFSYTVGISHCVFGYLQEACGRYLPITWTSLSLPDLAEDGQLPNNVFVKFTAGSRTYELWHKLGPPTSHYTGDPWTLRHQVTINCTATPTCHGWGMAVFTDRFTGLCPVPEQESLVALQELVSSSICEDPSPITLQTENEEPLVLILTDPACHSPHLTGGKAASLAALVSIRQDAPQHLQYTVPQGVVVTVAGWNSQLRACPELQAAIRSVDQAVGYAQPAQLRDACTRTVEIFEATVVCLEVAKALEESLTHTFQHQYHHTRNGI